MFLLYKTLSIFQFLKTNRELQRKIFMPSRKQFYIIYSYLKWWRFTSYSDNIHASFDFLTCHRLFLNYDIKERTLENNFSFVRPIKFSWNLVFTGRRISSAQQRSRSNLSTHCYLMSKSIMSNIVIGQFQNYKYRMWLQNLEVVW